MKFSEQLNEYMKELNISSKELSKASELSPDVISRYLNNKRTPNIDSEYFENLVNGLFDLGNKNGKKIEKGDIKNKLEVCIVKEHDDDSFKIFIENFNHLQESLGLSNSAIGKKTGYDSSYISRLKNGDRRPKDIDDFIDKMVMYLIKSYSDKEKKEIIAAAIGCVLEQIKTEEKYKNTLKKWFIIKHSNYNDIIHNFLIKMDDFRLTDFVNEDFSKVKTITTPIVFGKSKTYYGVSGRKNSEEDFIRTTLLSKADEDIFFYNDLPMSKVANDDVFKKRYVLAMSMILKKGLHLNIVHNINRPLEEMIIGLENWLPMYMTGAISPYYFSEFPSNMFCTSHMTSGSVALSGECFNNNEEKGKFYLTTKREELPYYKEKSKYLLKKAKPLMKIYNDEKQFEEFIKNENLNYQTVTTDRFKNMDFYASKKWIVLNKKISPAIHFVIYNEKLNSAIKAYLSGL